MERIESEGPNGYKISVLVISDAEKDAMANISGLRGVHQCYAKTHGSRRNLGYNEKHVDNSPVIRKHIDVEHLARLQNSLNLKRKRETILEE